MGVDLHLLVFTFPCYTDDAEARTVLRLERARKLFKDISEFSEAKGVVVPGTFCSYFKNMNSAEPKWGKTLVDIYGRPIKTLTAGELMGFAGHPDVTDSFHNRAAWAYLSQLPPEVRVALWWC